MTPRITVIVFEDRTSIGDPVESRRIFLHRREDIERYEAVLENVRDAESKSNPDRRYIELASSLKPPHPAFPVDQLVIQRLTQYRAAHGTRRFDLMRRTDEMVLQLLQEHSISAGPSQEIQQ